MLADAECGQICTLLTLRSSQNVIFEPFASLNLNCLSGIAFPRGDYSVLGSLPLIGAQWAIWLS